MNKNTIKSPPRETIVGGTVDSIKNHGLFSTFSSGCQYMWDAICDTYLDRKMGVRGTRRIPTEKLGHQTDENHFHIASDYRTFKKIMKLIDIDEDLDVFLDYGSGSGRILVLAGRLYRFRKIIGVELVEDMVELSRRNISNAIKTGNLKCEDIEVSHTDASEYEIPEEVSIIYFYNPFSGSVLRKALRKIRKSIDNNPRKVTIIVKSPEHFEREADDFGWLVKQAVMGRGIRYSFNIYLAE